MDNTVYLEEGIEKLHNCPQCKGSICTFPDMLSKPTEYGRFNMSRWYCHNCSTEYFQTEKKYNLDTLEGSRAYLESEGFDLADIKKQGRKELKRIKDKLI